MDDEQDQTQKSVAADMLMSDDDMDKPFAGVDGTTDETVDDPNDLNELSAKHTDRTPEAPDPDGPADPSATNGTA